MSEHVLDNLFLGRTSLNQILEDLQATSGTIIPSRREFATWFITYLKLHTPVIDNVKSVTINKHDKTRINILSTLLASLITKKYLPLSNQLVWLFSILTQSAQPQTPEAPSKQLFSNPSVWVFFAIKVLEKLENLLYNLNPSSLKLLVQLPSLREHIPKVVNNLRTTLNNITNKSHDNSSNEQGGNSRASNALQFKQETEYKINYKTNREQTLYHNREKCKDLFVEILREFASCSLDNDKLQQNLQLKVQGFFAILQSHNYIWFAQYFEKQIIELCTHSQTSELEDIDPTISNLAGPDKLRKLEQRFSSQKSAPVNTKVLHSNEQFLLKFLEVANNYVINSNLILLFHSRLINLSTLNGIDREFISRGGQAISKQIIQSKVIGRFLGFLLSWQWSLPYLGNAAINPGVPLADIISKLDLCGDYHCAGVFMDIMKIIRFAFDNNCLVLSVPWVLQFLKTVTSTSQQLLTKAKLFKEAISILKSIYHHSSLQITNKDFSINYLYLLLEIEDFFEFMKIDFITYESESSVQFSLATTTSSGQIVVDQQRKLLDDSFIYQNCPVLADVTLSLKRFHYKGNAEHAPTVAINKPVKKIPVIQVATTSTSLSEESKPSAPFQKLLKDWFFWQHPELTQLCEFISDKVVNNIAGEVLQSGIIEQSIENAFQLFATREYEEDIGIEQLEPVITSLLPKIMELVLPKAKESCTSKIQETVFLLAPLDADKQTRTIAISFTNDVACDSLSKIISSKLQTTIRQSLESKLNKLKKLQKTPSKSPLKKKSPLKSPYFARINYGEDAVFINTLLGNTNNINSIESLIPLIEQMIDLMEQYSTAFDAHYNKGTSHPKQLPLVNQTAYLFSLLYSHLPFSFAEVERQMTLKKLPVLKLYHNVINLLLSLSIYLFILQCPTDFKFKIQYPDYYNSISQMHMEGRHDMMNIDSSLKDVYDLLLAIFIKFAQIDFQLLNGLALYYISEKQYSKIVTKWKQVSATSYLSPSVHLLLVLSSLDLVIPSVIENNCISLLLNLNNQKKITELEETKTILSTTIPEYHKYCDAQKSRHYSSLNFSRLLRKLEEIKPS